MNGQSRPGQPPVSVNRNHGRRSHLRKDALAFLSRSQPGEPPWTEETHSATLGKLTATEASVMNSILAHEEYKPPETDTSIRDQPKYHDLNPYEVPKEKEKALWTAEMRRLFLDIGFDEQGNFKKPPTFKSQGPLNGDVSRTGYEKLNAANEAVTWCWAICNHDNELIAYENLREHFEVKIYAIFHLLLTRGLDTNHASKIVDDLHVPTFYALVDYLTAVCARVLVQISENQFWQSLCLAVLTKWATKMKILRLKPKEYAKRSLHKARALQLKDDTQFMFEDLQQFATYNAPLEDQLEDPAP